MKSKENEVFDLYVEGKKKKEEMEPQRKMKVTRKNGSKT